MNRIRAARCAFSGGARGPGTVAADRSRNSVPITRCEDEAMTLTKQRFRQACTSESVFAFASLLMLACFASVAEPAAAETNPPPLQPDNSINSSYPVDGYESAMDSVAQWLSRLAREQRLQVIWLFDESESMKDDQAVIRRLFPKLYAELGIFNNPNAESPILISSIVSFGDAIHAMTRKPTANVTELTAAIDKIPISKSGTENVFQSISAISSKHRKQQRTSKRKLAIIVVTDESGSDSQHLESAIAMTKQTGAIVFVMGPESVFGLPSARLRWRDPSSGLTHWLKIDRGPETADPEVLQFDGLRARVDTLSSGFGPYALTRLVDQTKGQFLIMPSSAFSNPTANKQRQASFLAMKDYRPELLSRREYLQSVQRSQFRAKIAMIVKTIDPIRDERIRFQTQNLPIENQALTTLRQTELPKILQSLKSLNQAIESLESIRPLRQQEASKRWQANYDLMLGQCLANRILVSQFLLAGHLRLLNPPKLGNPKNNTLNAFRSRTVVPFDTGLAKASKIDVEQLTRQHERANELFKFVIDTHPKTPWARFAVLELRRGFGVRLAEYFRDPRYQDVIKKIKIPRL